MVKEITENMGVKYPAPHCGFEYVLIRTEFLLHEVKNIEYRIIEWFKEKYNPHADGYSVFITKKGKWAVSYSNDHPLQHGSGGQHILTEEDFIEASKIKTPYPKNY